MNSCQFEFDVDFADIQRIITDAPSVSSSSPVNIADPGCPADTKFEGAKLLITGVRVDPSGEPVV